MKRIIVVACVLALLPIYFGLNYYHPFIANVDTYDWHYYDQKDQVIFVGGKELEVRYTGDKPVQVWFGDKGLIDKWMEVSGRSKNATLTSRYGTFVWKLSPDEAVRSIGCATRFRVGKLISSEALATYHVQFRRLGRCSYITYLSKAGQLAGIEVKGPRGFLGFKTMY